MVISGSDQGVDTALATDLGAHDYLVKPSAPKGLVHIIREKAPLWLPPEGDA